MAKTKTHGLADFGVKQSQPADDSFAPLSHDALTSSSHDALTSSSHDALTSSSHDAKKAKGDTVACTVRLPRAAWLKVQHLALDEGTSFQALAVAGLDAELKRRGLPGIEI